MAGPSSLDASVDIFAQVNPTPGTAEAVDAAWRRFVGDRRRSQDLDYFIRLARQGPQAQRTVAFAVLAQAVRGARTPQPVKDKVTPVIDAGWSDPASAPSLVQAIMAMRLQSQYEERLKAYGASTKKTP